MPHTTSSDISGANIISSSALRSDCFLRVRPAGVGPGAADSTFVFTPAMLRIGVAEVTPARNRNRKERSEQQRCAEDGGEDPDFDGEQSG